MKFMRAALLQTANVVAARNLDVFIPQFTEFGPAL